MGICSSSPNIPKAESPKFHHVKTASGAIIISDAEPLVIWEYLRDINTNQWLEYEPGLSLQINTAYSSDAKKCQIVDKIDAKSYEIDFNVMLETNVVTGWQRKIRIKPPKNLTISNNDSNDLDNKPQMPIQPVQSPQEYHNHNTNHNHNHNHHNILKQNYNISHNNNNNQDNNPLLEQEPTHKNQYKDDNGSYKWQWYSESIGWKDYDHKLSSKIDESFLNNMAMYQFKIRSNNTKYEIDFNSMKQCNLDTNKLRIIRRSPVILHNKLNNHIINDLEDDEKVYNDDKITDNQQELIQNERFIWEYYDISDDRWFEYDDNISLKIETVYHSNAAVARMKIHGNEYEIRLNELPMNQCNLKNGEISSIRRMIINDDKYSNKGKHHKRPSQIKKSGLMQKMKQMQQQERRMSKNKKKKNNKYVWKYKYGYNSWKVYPKDISSIIEKAFRNEDEQVTINLFNQIYSVQFNYLRQVNMSTNEMNEIARVDNLVKARTQSMFNKPIKNSNNNNNPFKQDNINNNANSKDNVLKMNALAAKKVNKKKKPNKRSATMDLTGKKGAPRGIDALISQQQKAMKFYNKKHSAKNSLMTDLPLNQDVIISNVNNKSKYIWKYKSDDGFSWLSYDDVVSSAIELAYNTGDPQIEIEKDNQIYEVRINLLQEIHFATNKIRKIQRFQKKPNKRAASAVYSVDNNGIDKMGDDMDDLDDLDDDDDGDDDDLDDDMDDNNGVKDEFDALATGLDAFNSNRIDDNHNDNIRKNSKYSDIRSQATANDDDEKLLFDDDNDDDDNNNNNNASTPIGPGNGNKHDPTSPSAPSDGDNLQEEYEKYMNTYKTLNDQKTENINQQAQKNNNNNNNNININPTDDDDDDNDDADDDDDDESEEEDSTEDSSNSSDESDQTDQTDQTDQSDQTDD